MTYTHITINELVLIEAYYKINTLVKEIATSLSRARETIYKAIRAFKSGVTTIKTTVKTKSVVVVKKALIRKKRKPTYFYEFRKGAHPI